MCSQTPLLKPNPHCDDLWKGAFGRGLEDEGGALRNEINASQRRPGRALLSLLPREDTARGWPSVPRHQISCLLDLGFPHSRAVRNQCVFLNHSVFCIL